MDHEKFLAFKDFADSTFRKIDGFFKSIQATPSANQQDKNEKMTAFFCKEFKDILSEVNRNIGSEKYSQLVKLEGLHQYSFVEEEKTIEIPIVIDRHYGMLDP